MKNIIITGANGFLGSAISKELTKRGFNVTCLVRDNSDISLLEDLQVTYIDYSNNELLNELFSKNDIVIHSAALTKAKRWQQIYKANVELTEKLTNLFVQNNMVQFIFLSSQAVSGPAINKFSPVKESDEANPLTLYGKSKFEAEEIIKRNIKQDWTILRPVSVFGPGDKDFLPLFKLVQNNLSFSLGFKEKLVNLIYVDDLVKMVSRSIGNQKTFKQTIFLANSNEISQKTLSKWISQIMHKNLFNFNIPFFLLYPIAMFAEIIGRSKNSIPVLNMEKIKEFKQSYWLTDTSRAEKLLGIKAI